MIYDLPKTVEFDGKEWDIDTDFRTVLDVLTAFEDPDLSNQEKAYVCLYNMYPDFASIKPGQVQAAYDAAIAFIDHGQQDDKRIRKKTMDWEQDAPLIFPAINSVAGFEVRNVEYMHWWTFIGYFMEIKDSTYSTVLSLRQKKWVHRKKLEKHEAEYWKNNKAICELKRKETQAEREERERLEALLNNKSRG